MISAPVTTHQACSPTASTGKAPVSASGGPSLATEAFAAAVARGQARGLGEAAAEILAKDTPAHLRDG